MLINFLVNNINLVVNYIRQSDRCITHQPLIRFICLFLYNLRTRRAPHTYIHTYIHTYAAALAVIRLYVKRVFKPSTFLTYLSKIAAKVQLFFDICNRRMHFLF